MNKLDENLYRAVANLMMDPVILFEAKDRDSGGELVTIRDKGIKAIKQAFKDAGYMTGPEWYAELRKETSGQLFSYRTDREQNLVLEVATYFVDAAKRVSGVKK